MKVRRVDVFTASLHLDGGFAHFAGRVTALEEVFVKLTGEDGLAGWGEVRGNMGYFSGESPAGIVAALRDVLSPLVVGRALRERGAVLEAATGRSPATRRQGGPRHRLARPRGPRCRRLPRPLAGRPARARAARLRVRLLRAARPRGRRGAALRGRRVPDRQGPGRPRAVPPRRRAGPSAVREAVGDTIRAGGGREPSVEPEGGDPAHPGAAGVRRSSPSSSRWRPTTSPAWPRSSRPSPSRSWPTRACSRWRTP